MWGFGSILALLLAMLLPGSANAATPDPSPAWYASITPAPGEGIKAMVTDLRQTVAENGLSHAITRATDWVKELELSWTAHRASDAEAAIAEASDVTTPTSNAAVLAAANRNALGNPAAKSTGWGPVSIISNAGGEHGWTMGHAQPVLNATIGAAPALTSSGMSHTGGAGAEDALASHDVELGVHIPFMPWNAQVAADHYWWGARSYGPQVSGTRLGLKFSPVENVQIEGGRNQDQRGSGGFVGLSYSVQLDQPK